MQQCTALQSDTRNTIFNPFRVVRLKQHLLTLILKPFRLLNTLRQTNFPFTDRMSIQKNTYIFTSLKGLNLNTKKPPTLPTLKGLNINTQNNSYTPNPEGIEYKYQNNSHASNPEGVEYINKNELISSSF